MIARGLARVLAAPLEVRDRDGVADAVVVLGAPPGPVLDERVHAGFALWRAGAAPRILVTGGPSRGLVEADVMAATLRALGVPDQALVIDRTAMTTADNAARAADLLGAGARVWLVSQPFHLRRARRLFRGAGLVAWCWRIDGGLQDQHPRRALRWIAREYAAWAGALLRR